MADNQGSFITGLTIGLFAGAASYFLLVTPKGKKVRQNLEKEWQAAQASTGGMPPSILSNSNVTSIRGLFASLREVIAETAQQSPTAPSQKRAKKSIAKKGDPRFKGV